MARPCVSQAAPFLSLSVPCPRRGLLLSLWLSIAGLAVPGSMVMVMSESYRDKLRSIGFLSKGQSKPVVSETRSEDGRRTKAVTDETGTVTEHTARVPGW